MMPQIMNILPSKKELLGFVQTLIRSEMPVLHGKKPKEKDFYFHAFEGIARAIKKPPTLGTRQYFLPGNCMIDLAHTAVVNMIFQKPFGTHVRLEDIRIL